MNLFGSIVADNFWIVDCTLGIQVEPLSCTSPADLSQSLLHCSLEHFLVATFNKGITSNSGTSLVKTFTCEDCALHCGTILLLHQG